MMPVHPPARSFTETLAEDTEKSLLADKLGFTELWLGEHFSATSEPIPSPMMFMASLLPRTDNLRFGTGVVCIPNHDPIVVAAEAAQVRSYEPGRFMLGVGPGGLFSDFELFGQTDHAVRNRKVVEAIGIMRQIWSQPALRHRRRILECAAEEFHSRAWHRLHAKPYQKGGPPISISLASPHSSARTAALNVAATSRRTSRRLIRWLALGDLQQSAARKPASGPRVTTGVSRAISWSRRPTRKLTTA